MTARVVILASGSGTNAEALMRAAATGVLDAEIVAVITNNPDAGVLERAARFGVATEHVEHRGRTPEQRAAADARLIEVLRGFDPDLVVLAGWMRILGAEVGATFPIVNLHPAQPGDLPGINSIERAFVEFEAGERHESGVMVHWVPDDGVDVGPVIVTEVVPFKPGDTRDSFENRMHETEHRLIVQGVAQALREQSSN